MLWKECMKKKKKTYKNITITTSYKKEKMCKLSKNDCEETSELFIHIKKD